MSSNHRKRQISSAIPASWNGGFQRFLRYLHEGGPVRPQERCGDGAIRRRPVGLVVNNEHPIRRDGEPVDTTGNPGGAEATGDLDFGAAVFTEGLGEIGVVENSDDLGEKFFAIVLHPAFRKSRQVARANFGATLCLPPPSC